MHIWLFKQSDHTRNAVVARALAWKGIIPIIFKKRREDPVFVASIVVGALYF